MPDLKNCEYFLVEYAPSPLRETRVAIGLFLFEDSGRLVRYGFANDWRRARCLDPQADLAMLANLPAHFDSIRAATARERSLYDQLLTMREDCSGSIQISAPKGVRTADPEREFQLLLQEHIATPQPAREKRAARAGSRPWIHAQLSDALHRHALWERLTKDVPVTEFTAPGDGFRIDFSYRPNGVTNYLHAISLERDWNQAKLLSYTFWRIREKTQARMTAIVADPPADLAVAQNCRQILTSAQIQIQPLSQLDPYLEDVRRELRLM